VKIREQEGGTGLAWWGGVGIRGRGEKLGKGHGRVNIVKILCTRVCKWKIKPVETILGIGGGIKENGEGGEFKL
jgi:hypothetical protein